VFQQANGYYFNVSVLANNAAVIKRKCKVLRCSNGTIEDGQEVQNMLGKVNNKGICDTLICVPCWVHFALFGQYLMPYTVWYNWNSINAV
jgi:hypothetical protein